ncbi:MAG: head-tail adaptor protein [Bacilli bacterium]|uniref:head-tail adaptor protein n=1 Tax=Clostridium sp. TaxID=1506 RepID=UPI002FC70398
MNVAIGELNQIAEIQRFTHKHDEQGFPTEIWDTIAKVRCKVDFDDRLIRQVIKEHGVNATMAQLFIFRYVPGITVQDRVVYKDKCYEIYAVENLEERNRFLKVWGRAIW